MPAFDWKSSWVKVCVLFICSSANILSILGSALVEYKAMGKIHKNMSPHGAFICTEKVEDAQLCHLITCSFINGEKSHQHVC